MKKYYWLRQEKCGNLSRTLSKEERRYSATELECTGLHDSLIHWRVYLQNGIPFEVIVDHYALVYMVTKMSDAIGNLRLNTLCLGLQEFTFSVIHRKGALHLGLSSFIIC